MANIFYEFLDMKRSAAKIVPKFLNFEQKQSRVDIVITLNDVPDLLKRVITCDESWAYVYSIETNA